MDRRRHKGGVGEDGVFAHAGGGGGGIAHKGGCLGVENLLDFGVGRSHPFFTGMCQDCQS